MTIHDIPKGLQPKEYARYTTVLSEAYHAGMTYIDIGKILGVHCYSIADVMRKNGHKGVLRMPMLRGPKHPKWKGTAASYEAKHIRVVTLRGRASHCERCGMSDPERVYDWANLTGDYDNMSDYQQMCRPCHRSYDKQRERDGFVSPVVKSTTRRDTLPPTED